MTAAEAARHILEAASQGKSVVSVTTLAGNNAGERMLIYGDHSVLGTLGSADAERAAVVVATQALAAHASLLTDNLFAEFHAPTEQLVIFGAGHIAVPLAELGVMLGFDVTVLDDREEFAVAERFGANVRVVQLDLDAPLRNIVVTPHTYVVLVTRAHKNDFDCLRVLLQQERQPRYVGMIGSRRRVRAAFTALLESGITETQLERVHAPVGVDIGAETPAEIAVSIAAELIRVRRGADADAGTLSAGERVLERFFTEKKT